MRKEDANKNANPDIIERDEFGEELINVDFDDNYGDVRLKVSQVNALSKTAVSLIKHRGKLQLFNRKTVATQINDVHLSEINYKNVEFLRKFLTQGGRILSSRITGADYTRQRLLKREIKRARVLGLLPFPDQSNKKAPSFNNNI